MPGQAGEGGVRQAGVRASRAPSRARRRRAAQPARTSDCRAGNRHGRWWSPASVVEIARPASRRRGRPRRSRASSVSRHCRAPALDLARIVVAGLAEIGEARRLPVECVQRGQRFGHGEIHGAALVGATRRAGRYRGRRDRPAAPSDRTACRRRRSRHGTARTGGTGTFESASAVRMRYSRSTAWAEGRRSARRLLAQHEPRAGVGIGQEEGRVRLAAADPLQRHRASDAPGQGRAQEGIEPGGVEFGSG